MSKQSKQAGIAHPPVDTMVSYCVAAFKDYLEAEATLQNAKALWDAARLGLRTELGRAYKVIEHGKPWDRFLAAVRAALVKAKVCGTPKEAGQLIRNQLKALTITGKGSNGKRKGRKEKVAAVVEKLSDKSVQARLVAILAYVADTQKANMGDDDIVEICGNIAKLANGLAL